MVLEELIKYSVDDLKDLNTFTFPAWPKAARRCTEMGAYLSGHG